MTDFAIDNKTFFMDGGESGILFVHGFTGNPEEMKPMARYFNDKGYTCLGIRLKGHCTTPEDMACCSDVDWLMDVTGGYTLLRRECKRVFVCGISLGGSLGLYLAENYGVDGLVCMSTPIFVYYNGVLPAVKVVKHFKKYIASRPANKVWTIFSPGYDKIPVSSVDSLYRIVRNVKRRIDKVKCPVLVIQSHGDRIVRPKSAQFIYNNISSIDKTLLWLEKSSHQVIEGEERDNVFKDSYSFFKRYAH